MSTKRTPSGIKRPTTGTFANFATARTVARDLNVKHGRGRRAIKAQDGNHAIIFRPAVAANKQRQVRDLGAAV